MQLLSDLHSELWGRNGIPVSTNVVLKKGGKLLVLAGDIGNPIEEPANYELVLQTAAQHYVTTLVVAGNHEYHTRKKTPNEIDDFLRIKRHNNVHFLQCETHEHEGVSYAGCTLWTDVQRGDFKSIADSKYMGINTYYKMHCAHRKWLAGVLSGTQPTVVITHHLPSYRGINPRFETNTCFATDLERYFKPPLKTWVAGHTHEQVDVEINGIPLWANPVGYPGEYRVTSMRTEAYLLSKMI